MQQSAAQLEKLGAAVAVVTFELNVVAENYVRQTELPWPMLVDRDRSLYQAYGMQRGRWWDLSGPKVIWLYFQLFFRGRRLKRITDDVRQLGGDIVIDPQGIVRLHHVGVGPADRPPVERLLEVIKSGSR